MKQELMMKQRNNNIEAQVTRTMKQLDEMKPLEVNHFFRARLMQRVEREFGPGSKHSNSAAENRFALRLAFFTLLIIVNFGAAVVSIQQNNPKPTSGISEMLDKLSDEYSSHEFAYYDQASANAAETGTTENQAP